MMKLLNEFKLNNDQILQLEKYRNLLLSWNEKFNLTAITKLDEIEEKHFVDSLEILKFFNLENKSLLDVGSGAGFPGLVLAIAVPTLSVTLLESNGKKVTFLNAVKKELNLKNVNVILGRSEAYNNREFFDIVTARAVKELSILLEITFHLVKVGGSLIAYKGLNAELEIKNAAHAFKCLQIKNVNNIKYNLPNSNDSRSLIEIKKEVRTINKYPRNYSEIANKPL